MGSRSSELIADAIKRINAGQNLPPYDATVDQPELPEHAFTDKKNTTMEGHRKMKLAEPLAVPPAPPRTFSSLADLSAALPTLSNEALPDTKTDEPQAAITEFTRSFMLPASPGQLVVEYSDFANGLGVRLANSDWGKSVIATIHGADYNQRYVVIIHDYLIELHPFKYYLPSILIKEMYRPNARCGTLFMAFIYGKIEYSKEYIISHGRGMLAASLFLNSAMKNDFPSDHNKVRIKSSDIKWADNAPPEYKRINSFEELQEAVKAAETKLYGDGVAEAFRYSENSNINSKYAEIYAEPEPAKSTLESDTKIEDKTIPSKPVETVTIGSLLAKMAEQDEAMVQLQKEVFDCNQTAVLLIAKMSAVRNSNFKLQEELSALKASLNKP
jgi:hypothetical protein